MSIDDYSFVFDDWHPTGFVVVRTGYSRCIHNGLTYIEFHAVTTESAVSVRCDPCSATEAMAGYRGMVRRDLELAVAKQRRLIQDLRGQY